MPKTSRRYFHGMVAKHATWELHLERTVWYKTP